MAEGGHRESLRDAGPEPSAATDHVTGVAARETSRSRRCQCRAAGDLWAPERRAAEEVAPEKRLRSTAGTLLVVSERGTGLSCETRTARTKKGVVRLAEVMASDEIIAFTHLEVFMIS